MMMAQRNRWLVVAAVAATAISSTAAQAMRLRLENVGGTGVVISDNATGDLNPLVGAITFSGALSGGFAVNVTTGTSKPVIGSPTGAELDLNSVNVQSSGAGTLRIVLEDVGYTVGSEVLGVGAAIGGTLTAPMGSTATFQSWVDPVNAVPALGPDVSMPAALAALGTTPATSVAACTPDFTAGPGAFSQTCSATFTKMGAYSLFAKVTVVFTGAGSVSFDELQSIQLANGDACGENNECLSQFCVDSVCCNTACDDSGFACDVPPFVGTCRFPADSVPAVSPHGLLLTVLALAGAGVMIVRRRYRPH